MSGFFGADDDRRSEWGLCVFVHVEWFRIVGSVGVFFFSLVVAER